LLPSTFGKVEVEVEGTTFPQAGPLKIVDLSPWGRGGTWGAGKVPSGTNM
jgi:hypothetical protein